MSAPPEAIEAIFLTALEIDTSLERARFLDGACQGKAELRTEVEQLLHDHSHPSSALPATQFMGPQLQRFLPTLSGPEPPPIPLALPVKGPVHSGEEIGTWIAERYRLLSILGEGGMGTVFQAEQTHPIRRVVALKVIRPEIDCAHTLARFNTERQALAMMDHANIAKVFDAGTTQSGRPFFVMEFVPGLPITRFCDAHRLTIAQRLELFIQLCNAVQHAHQKGIIHRDLKPGNILVQRVDGVPSLKVIDFGLAKELHEPIVGSLEKTLAGTTLGTPLYMAPEQIGPGAKDTDTRADIYALGVIFYELLTGTTPLNPDEMQQLGMAELFRMIREQEPARPSDVVRDAIEIEAIAQKRGIEPDKLSRMIRGDLDWIATKALEKDRSRRYDTASGLAADIRAYLVDEPIKAGPPSTTYRLAKFVRRNRGAVLATAVTLAVLVIGVIGTTLGMLRAREEARLVQEEKQKVELQWKRAEENASLAQGLNDFLQYDLLGQADIRNQSGFNGAVGREPGIKVRTLLDRAAQRVDGRFQAQPLTEAAIRRTIGATYRALGEYAAAQGHLEKALELFSAHLGNEHTDTVTAMNLLATLYQDQGRFALAEPLHREVLKVTVGKLGENHVDSLVAKINLALLYQNQGNDRQAEALYQEVLSVAESQLGKDHPKTLTVKHNLATLYQSQGNYDEADRLAKQVVSERQSRLGHDHPQTLAAQQNLATLYKNQGNYKDAEQLYLEVWHLSCEKLGKDHSDTLTVQHNLATVYQMQLRYADAETLYQEVLRLREIKLGVDHLDTLTTKHNLATLYQTQGRYSTAEKIYKEVLDVCVDSLGNDHTETLTARNNLALLYKIRGKYDQAEALYQKVLAISETRLGKDHPNTLAAKHNLAALYQAQGNYSQAEKIHQEVVQLSEAKFGMDHPNTLTAKYNLALLYVDAEQWVQAEKLCLDLLDAAQKKSNSPALWVAGFQGQLGLVRLALKKFSEAESVLKACLATREKHQPHAWTTANTRVLLGAVCLGQRKYPEAEQLLLEGYTGLKDLEDKLPAHGKVRLVSACYYLQELYKTWGKAELALKWRARTPPELAPSPREAP